jgi:hypothetical protein
MRSSRLGIASACCIIGLGIDLAAAHAQSVAKIFVCEKEKNDCTEENARSVYTLPMESMMCFIPAQQELANMVVYDEAHDKLRIDCRMKSPG